jgi:hypothetical protein
MMSECFAQTEGYIAIIPPFHSRQEMARTESPLQLFHQLFVVFVYSNAVAVFSASDFINQSDNFVDQEFALPSSGHDENGDNPGGRISNGILNVLIWEENEQINPQLIEDGTEEWYTIRSGFDPHKNHRINALFWAQTSLEDYDSIPGLDTSRIINGDRGFIIDLAHASDWNDVIQSIEVYVILKDGLQTEKQNFSAIPTTFDQKDSTLIWSMDNIEPSLGDNIEVTYESSNNVDPSEDTMDKLSGFMVNRIYDQLIDYEKQLEE